MAQPVWITPAGSLGIIPEGVFYSTPLQAVEPEVMDTVYYQLIAGQLPPGIQISQTGILAGIPQAQATIQGVPELVSRDVTSKFAVRAYTTKIVNGVIVVDRLTDRTFELTVSGQDAPEFITPPGQIAQYYDGSLVPGLQIQYTDLDPDDTVVVRLVSGQLPPGLSINSRGLISGFIQPQDENSDYEFTLEVTDGKVGGTNIRTFSIYVWSRSILSADDTFITADNTFITADVSPVRIPILLNPQGSIGSVRNDNWFAYKFNALDLDGDQVQYIVSRSTPGPLSDIGLTLDPNTGWLYGAIPDLGLTDIDYEFDVRVYKQGNIDQISDPYTYSLNVIGQVDTEVVWITDSNLGTINNGDISLFAIEAAVGSGQSLQYELESGSDSSLPQGLALLSTGEIVGRVSFNTFALDGGTTTFDVAYNTTPTTFDMTHTFTVRAFSSDNLVSVTKTFTITVIRLYDEPYDNLYIEAMPPQNDRDLLNSLLQNTDIFPRELIYRPDDFYFGVARNVTYYHAYGLTAATLDDYVSSLDLNHYWKNLTLGEIKVAQARNSAGEVIYEAVYSEIIDDLVNDQGQSVSKQVEIPYPIDANTPAEISEVYPNSLINMRDQVIDTVGQISNVLPRWMVSKQSSGQVLGFVPAWVICYAKPGRGEQIAYYIRENFTQPLNLVDYEVDRYELDRLLSHNWNPVTDNWEPTPAATTFDINCHYQLPEPNDSSFVFDGGIDYEVGDQIRILGSQVGGVDGPYNPDQDQFGNDIVITVQEVDSLGTILQAQAQGTAPMLSAGDIYTNVAGTNISGSGTGATWDIEVVPGVETVFDGGSLEFIAPVDMYSNTQEYDKYLVFPKRNILR